MSYFRLRDIKTPPFAYVLNRDAVIRSCQRCQMPLREMGEGLRIEVCARQDDLSDIAGKPLMADYWLVGDEAFGDCLAETVPDAFVREPIGATTPDADLGGFFLFRPRIGIQLDTRLREQFPAMSCFDCGRETPDIPFNCQPMPDASADAPAAFLTELYLEGYDYLIHERYVETLSARFPQMIFEKIAAEPVLL